MTRKILCMLLSVVLMLGLIPLTAAADETDEVFSVEILSKYYKNAERTVGGKSHKSYFVDVGSEAVKLTTSSYVTINNKYYEGAGFLIDDKFYASVTIPAYDGTDSWIEKWDGTITIVYVPHTHNYKYLYTRNEHWQRCVCGKIITVSPHVDPALDADKICHCGYIFNNNTDLTTLWLSSVQLEPSFRKDITTYTATVPSWYTHSATTVIAQTFDAKATYELPADMTLKEGMNKYEVIVTAEDKVSTKTYTVLVEKPSLVDGITIANQPAAETATTTATFSTKTLNLIASAAISDAAGEKLAERAAENGSTRIVIDPTFNKWNAASVEVSVSGAALRAMAEGANADLVVTTDFADVTIPNDVLSSLANAGEMVTITVLKDGTAAITADGGEVAGVSDKIKITAP